VGYALVVANPQAGRSGVRQYRHRFWRFSAIACLSAGSLAGSKNEPQSDE
jgi:hypothetical protein